MKHQLRRLIAPVVLIGALILPMAMTQAQQGRPRRAGPQARPTGPQARPTGLQARAAGATQRGTAQQDSTQQTQATGQGPRGRRRGMGGSASKSATTGGTVTVIRQVNQVRLSPAVIKTINSTDDTRRFVTVRGAAITARPGSSIWSLSNGGFMVVGGGTAKPIAETVTGPVSGCPGCVYVQACYCPGYDPNKNDGCKFDGPANGSAANCRQKEGVPCNCHFKDFFIMDDGSQVILTP